MVRKLASALPDADFLRQPVAREMVGAKLLVDFEQPDPGSIVSPRVAFVSQPSEWCRLHLLDAAHLTLDVAEQALTAGFELKDASAWNVIFDGSAPVFCDHLSFDAIRTPQWRALGQFARHFTLPLLVAEKRGLPVHSQFRMCRDGTTPQLARSLCGWRMFLTSSAPFAFAAGISAERELARPQPASASRPDAQSGLHANLLRYCRFTLPSRRKIEARLAGQGKGWSSYTDERTHYSSQDLQNKLAQVGEWISRLGPRWVLDLGANTGEFSMLAARSGARVVAVDSDHDCIERLYFAARNQSALTRNVHAVVAALDDLCAGRGWSGREAPGLMPRLAGRCDLVMMLGLVHHLMISCAIPAEAVAQFAAELASGSLIVEIIPENDPKFRELVVRFDRGADAVQSCGAAAQRLAFEKHFAVVDRRLLPDSGRELLLLQGKPA